MIVTLRTQRVRTLEQVRAFLDGSEAVDFAGVDEQLGQMSGAATRKVLRRQWQVFGDPRFERLSELSNGHLYNLRKSRTYRNVRRVWTRKRYRDADVMTPYEKLKSLENAERYLAPGITFEALDTVAHSRASRPRTPQDPQPIALHEEKALAQDLEPASPVPQDRGSFNTDSSSAYSSVTLPLQAHFGIGLGYPSGKAPVAGVQSLHLAACRLAAATVVDDVIRSRKPRAAVDLSAQHGLGSMEVDAVPIHQALELDLTGTVDNRDTIHQLSKARLDQQGDHRDGVGRPHLLKHVQGAGADQGVQQRLERLACGRVGKYHLAQGRAVECAGCANHPGAKLLAHGFKTGLARSDHVPRDLIGVDDAGAQIGEDARHDRLAAGDAAGEAHPIHHALIVQRGAELRISQEYLHISIHQGLAP